MAELANGTAIQTAGPAQEVLDRSAPLVQNRPIPNPLAMAGFNAVDDGDGQDGDDQDEAVVDAEEELEED
ncbi:hypothetical protein AC579_8601 [Pseudocercospora musae]|uniref:Uncharacterized protein n=1 Tax=Pseudocercospora musae TaxID=113226 RepID=A0A139I022_9PEZI|nr:hypothetical protein AC579_8601 [Pseudocercospora musae]